MDFSGAVQKSYMTQRFRRTVPERLARLPKELFRFSSYNNIKKHT
ncbi:hypothetical protein JPSP7_01040 [Staphylococcus pseudintermedius]